MDGTTERAARRVRSGATILAPASALAAALGVAALLSGGCDGGDGLEAFNGSLSIWTFRGSADVSIRSRSGCPTARRDLAATLNGIPIQVSSRGGSFSNGVFSEACDGITLSVDKPVPPTAQGRMELRVWDGSGRIEADFGDFLSPRMVELVDPSVQPIYLGEEVAVRLLPSPARLGAENLTVELSTDPPASHTTSSRTFDVAGRSDGDKIWFTVPANNGEPTDRPITYRVTTLLDPNVPVYRCFGVEWCQATRDEEPAPATLDVINRRRDETDLCYRCECPCNESTGSASSTSAFRCDPSPCQCPEGPKTFACTSHVPIEECPPHPPTDGGDCSLYSGTFCYYQDCAAGGVVEAACVKRTTWKITASECAPVACGDTVCSGGQICKTTASVGACIPDPCGTGPIVSQCLVLDAGCEAVYGTGAPLRITCE